MSDINDARLPIVVVLGSIVVVLLGLPSVSDEATHTLNRGEG